MRLVKQSFLYFKEGNSDKVYEIDLCDVGNDKYVVNFRYGRKGSNLKEGSKTPVPVSLTEAQKIYNEVEQEKLLKGYTTSESGVSSIPKAAAFRLNTDVTIAAEWMSWPNSRNKAILQRLHNAVQGNTSHRTNWKLSRVIWKAGEYKIKEAAPYIIKLYNDGDAVHQYSCTWALARSGNEAATKALQQIYREHTLPVVSKIAGAGLLSVSNALQKEEHLTHYINSLPEDIKAAVELNQPKELDALLQERITQQQPQYSWLENIYLVSVEKRWIHAVVKKILQQIPLKPGYFKHIRSVFKLAELLDDFEISGMLACRFEREKELFAHHLTSTTEYKVYMSPLREYVNPKIELQKKNSRLAYSQRTRQYFRQRVHRRLQMFGKANNLDYVKLATAVLISYDRILDFKEPWSKIDYKWNGRNYAQVETRYPQNARAVFLHQLLSGDHPEIKLVNNSIWRLKSEQELQANGRSNQAPAANTQQQNAGVLKKIMGLFGKKKETAGQQPVHNAAAGTAPVNENGTPFLHLWNKLPQSYVQLLMEAQMDEIHEFAKGGLTTHPSWNEIKEKLDKHACIKLLLSPFEIPAEFGLSLTVEKFSNEQADADLVIAMLSSNNTNARVKGKQWAEAGKEKYLQQSDFVTNLLFISHESITGWAKDLIKSSQLSSDVKNAVTGKAVAAIMAISEMNATNEATIKRASEALLEIFGNELQQVSLTVIADLLQHPVPPVLLFGLQLLKAKKQQINPQELNKSLLFGLLQHSYAPVRDMGISLFTDIPADVLLKYQEEIIVCCTSVYSNIRQGLAPVVDRMAQQEKAFGDKAAEMLMPCLLRKETSEGLHEDVSRLLCTVLSGHLQNANKETALNLLYSNYSPAQNVGVVILEKYTDAAQLTIPQVIALGGHENLNVRNWCWSFYKQQVARIKYEKEAAVKILESKWQDTRQFAMQYFRDSFSESDWTIDALITLADSIKPDVEAYGRELITRFFTGEDGTAYLLKLSQHPSEKMQLFATNYLERFAADNVAKIQSLEFYFRSVLTRVNKSRIAKNRIYHFLLIEGRKSEEAAKAVSAILSDISATAAIGDKAKCIEVLLQLRSLYEVTTPLLVKEIETRA
jgi:hypothetical protein